jgi:hypothetical protein
MLEKCCIFAVPIKHFEIMKEFIQHFREQPKEAIKEVAMCVMIFAVCGAMLFLSAILQGCTVTKGTTVRGKATIVTTDTTVVKHNGTLKFKKSMFNN